MQKGVVKWFNDARGYGFIAKEDGSGDVFVHYRNISSGGRHKTLRDGDLVEFDVENTQRGPQALNVTSIGEG